MACHATNGRLGGGRKSSSSVLWFTERWCTLRKEQGKGENHHGQGRGVIVGEGQEKRNQGERSKIMGG